MSRIESIFKALNQKIEDAETIDDIKSLLKVMSAILEGHVKSWAHRASIESEIAKWREDNE